MTQFCYLSSDVFQSLTAYPGEADEQRAALVGFQKHLAKPLDPTVGIAAVSELGQLYKNGHSS
ncbi:hypothetical protein C7B65_07150 [Phormidesmis priestleyi ULC007]|uniref:Uncharacterized protein n=2 Tax=Phormidesmis priestleyi TaxID=268141 RepID=A0A2T1DJI5_9CYAN|nr:hypothetical protein [Phormidesmis priestleyi]PSB20668.1 hypothetical protein C7B65_07150 [Phormidesmis priestleyi ULC007]PZO54338.1 MAG: hypothetical protein DCF14_02795 [Phormidesmis priestleyi]